MKIFESLYRNASTKIERISNSELLKNSSLFTNTKTMFKKVFFYENNRWMLVSGFIPTNLERPHYSDVSGNFQINPKEVPLEHSWSWKGNWEIVLNQDTDEKGWSYANSFGSTFSSVCKKFSFVRRRLWARKCYKNFECGNSSIL